jgi:glycosyltransferase involved in cell wall biosynthesis
MKISVLMAVHNCAEYLPASIESILNQTIGSFEFIIIDDGSNNSVAKVLNNYHDRRIRKFRFDENIGLTRCLNIALDLAEGDIFVRHDGDDVALPERLEVEIPLLTGRVGLVSCWAEAINNNGDTIQNQWIERDLQKDADEVERILSRKNCILSPGAIFTREVFNRIGYFDPQVKYAQDYNYWLRLVQQFAIDIAPEVLVKKRVHSEAVWSKKHDQDWQAIARNRAIDNPTIPKVHNAPIFSRYIFKDTSW